MIWPQFAGDSHCQVVYTQLQKILFPHDKNKICLTNSNKHRELGEPTLVVEINTMTNELMVLLGQSVQKRKGQYRIGTTDMLYDPENDNKSNKVRITSMHFLDSDHGKAIKSPLSSM